MSRPSSKQLLLTSSKAIVKLQRRNLASLTAAAAAAGPLQHHQHQLLLLASQQQQQQPSQTASGSVAGGSSPALVPSSSSSGGAPSSSAAGSSKARATAGWSAVIEGPAQQPTAALFDLTAPAYRPVSSAASQPVALSATAAAAGSQREQQHRPSTPPPSSSASLLPVVVPPTVRTRRESASSARPPTTSTREPASIAQQPASPTQGHALPAASSAAYPYGPPRALWPADGPTNAAPAHVRPEPSSRLVFETGAFGIPKAVAYVPFTSSATSPKGKARADQPPEPSDGTLAQVGEDAYFVRASGFVHALGIADGVGGWAKRKDAPNANAGRFSSLLMGHISAEVARSSAGPSLLVADWASSRGLDVPGQGAGDLDPVVVMQKGYERCLEQARREGLQGSATALLALLSEDQLRIANLGDCCLTLIRNGEIFFRTTEMQHSVRLDLLFLPDVGRWSDTLCRLSSSTSRFSSGQTRVTARPTTRSSTQSRSSTTTLSSSVPTACRITCLNRKSSRRSRRSSARRQRRPQALGRCRRARRPALHQPRRPRQVRVKHHQIALLLPSFRPHRRSSRPHRRRGRRVTYRSPPSGSRKPSVRALKPDRSRPASRHHHRCRRNLALTLEMPRNGARRPPRRPTGETRPLASAPGGKVSGSMAARPTTSRSSSLVSKP